MWLDPGPVGCQALPFAEAADLLVDEAGAQAVTELGPAEQSQVLGSLAKEPLVSQSLYWPAGGRGWFLTWLAAGSGVS